MSVASSIGAMLLFDATKKLDIAINKQESNDYNALKEQVDHQLTQVIMAIKNQNSYL